MNKFIFTLSIMLMSALQLLHPVSATAQDAVKGREAKDIVEAICSPYKNWNRAAWSGRLSTDMLPVSATMKVYMERGRLILISLRAPLLGEVARIEIDPDSVLIANKLKRCYYSRQISSISELAPDLTDDVQALLLGRMFVIGQGELTKKSVSKINIFPTRDEGCYMILPETPDYLQGAVYGFSTDPDLRLGTFVAAYGREEVESAETADGAETEITYEPEVQLQTEISYREGRGAVAEIQASYHSRSYTATLNVDEIEWGARSFSRIDVSGYKSTSFRQVLRF